jgi:hypothetical protein
MLSDFKRSRGFALITSLLLLLLLSGIAVGTIYMIVSEKSVGGNDLQDTQAYYGAEAAMEKMMSDLALLYHNKAAPLAADINTLGTVSYQPTLAGITYNTYSLSFNSTGGIPTPQWRNITTGQFAGLNAEIIPITLTVDALGSNNADVSMIRSVEVALIPVFQFGVFSNGDLSFYPGANFDFTGRVHTNGNLFLAVQSGYTMTFHSKITAYGEVIRQALANGYLYNASGGYSGDNVNIPMTALGCDSPAPSCRAMTIADYGSEQGALGSTANSGWVTLAKTTYNSMIGNYKTGVHSLQLPFVAEGYRPIEIIRRPWPSEMPSGNPALLPGTSTFDNLANITQFRLYTLASIRVLLNDSNGNDANGNPYFPTPGTPVRLANLSPYFTGSSSSPSYGGTAAAGKCTPSSSTFCGTAFAEAMTQQATGAGSGNSCVNLRNSPSTWPSACIYEPGLGPTPPGTTTSSAACSNDKSTDAGKLYTGCGDQCWHGLPTGRGSAKTCTGVGTTWSSSANNDGTLVSAMPSGSYQARQDFVLPSGNAAGNCVNLSTSFIANYPASNDTNAYCWPLIDGYLLVQAQQTDGTYTDVTQEWLGYGIGQSDPTTVDLNNTTVVDYNAILSFQRYVDIDGDGTADVCSTWSTSPCSTQSASAPYNPYVTVPNQAANISYNGVATYTYTSGVTKLAYANGDPRAYYPLQLYDAREGESRPGGPPSSYYTGTFSVSNGTGYNAPPTYPAYTANGANACGMNGIINIIELNVHNLQQWLFGNLPNSPMTGSKTGQSVNGSTQNGYIFYFSDRRGMNADTNANAFPLPIPGQGVSPTLQTRLTGGYGFTDVVNASSSIGAPNGSMDATGENYHSDDPFGQNPLDTFGMSNVYKAFSNTQFPASPATPDPFATVACTSSTTAVWYPFVAMKNKVTGARHALRLVNGGLGNLPTTKVTNSTTGVTSYVGGFTVASENPVYVMGNYNAVAEATPFSDPACSTVSTSTTCHVPAAVIADAVTLLSNNWSDAYSFLYPNNTQSRKGPATSYYRLAIAQGKTPTATYANYTGIPANNYVDFGTDGGVHNFLRYLENWGNGSALYYDGSMVSFYYSEYATGYYKLDSGTVYTAPTRTYQFDTDFQTYSLLPPGTPMMRDVLNVGFQQVFTPY